MRVSQVPQQGDEVHAHAVRRLGEARDEQSRLTDKLAAAAGTQAEDQAARELATGRAGVTAREAWLVWVERGV